MHARRDAAAAIAIDAGSRRERRRWRRRQWEAGLVRGFYRADGARPRDSAAAAMLGGTSDKLDEVERMSSAFRDAMADGLYCLSDVHLLYLCITDEAIAKHIGRDVPSLDAR